ncbi:MAG: DUF4403 family protein [Cloacibacterium sp.]|nr:DUF4403 family protein [Cloacibacterium sp.]
MRLSLIFVFAFVFGFSQTETYQFPKIKSSISIPMSLPISEIQRLTNRSIVGTLYEDQSYENNNNDQLKTKVEKDGDIVLKALTNNRLMFSVPLKIWAEKGVGTLGVYSYQSTQFRVVMNFISSVEFLPNWSLKTSTTTAGFVWKEKPILDYGQIKIPITSLIEGVLTKQQAKFTTVIDDEIKKKMNLQPHLLAAWNQFAHPVQISEEYNTWLKITPQTVMMTPVEFYADKIKSTIGIDLFSETFTGITPAPNALVNSIPNYIPAQNLGQNFILQTTANIPFSEATQIAKNQFLGKEFPFSDGKSKIKVEDIKVYPENENIVIEILTSGKVNGISYIKGLPIYDAEKRKIGFSKTDFKLKTKNLFQKILTSLFEGKITRMIEQDYGIPLHEIETNSRKSIEESLNKEPYPGLKLHGKVLELRPSQFLVGQNHITAVITTSASLQLKISGLSF